MLYVVICLLHCGVWVSEHGKIILERKNKGIDLGCNATAHGYSSCTLQSGSQVIVGWGRMPFSHALASLVPHREYLVTGSWIPILNLLKLRFINKDELHLFQHLFSH